MKPGYTVEQWQEMRQEDLGFLENAVTSLTPFACLSANALAHLKSDWIDWQDEVVRIDVPHQADCNSFKFSSGDDFGHPAPLIPRENPCQYCRQKGSTDRFEHLWADPERDNSGFYTTYLNRKLAAPAVELLEQVFLTRGRPEFAVSPNTVCEAARTVENENTDSGTYSYSKFLRTGPVLYAEYGLSKRDIADLLRYPESSVNQIVERTPGVNFSQMSTISLLKTVNEQEPVTVAKLAEKIETSRGSTHYRLTQLREEGRVTVMDNEMGAPAATWKTTENWAAPFCCQQCEFETRSLTGIRTHRQQMHN